MEKKWFTPKRVDTGKREEWKEIKDFSIMKPEITKGSNSIIYLCKNTKTGEKLLMKTYSSKWAKENESLLREEFNNLKELGEIRISPKIFSFPLRTTNSVYLPIEMCNCGSLDIYLRLGQTFIEEGLRQIGFFLIRVLKYFHGNKKIHRDINPSHILAHIDEKTGKISFRLIGCHFIKNLTTGKDSSYARTPEYCAPENLDGIKYSFPVDIWSFGITLYELAVGVTPSKISPNYLDKIEKGKSVEFPSRTSTSIKDKFRDLINGCLKINPKDRYTIDQLEKHPFFAVNSSPEISPVIDKQEIPRPKPPKELSEEEQRELIQTNFFEFLKYVIERDPSKKEKLKAVKKDTLDPYVDAAHVAEGGFSEIYKCYHKDTKKIYGMKILKTRIMTSTKIAMLLIGEIEIMLDLSNSPFTIKLYDYFVYKNELILVMEFCNGGDLENYVKEVTVACRRHLAQEEIYLIAKNLASGLDDMHKINIMHRDIKPKNILLNVDPTSQKITDVKLCDYGLSRKIQDDSGEASSIVGTFDYFAPELYRLLCQAMKGKKGGKYDNKVDVWSFGVLLFYIAYGATIFIKPNTKEQVLKEGKIKFPDKPKTSVEYKNIIKACLQKDPCKRPSFEEILKMPFFSGVDIPFQLKCEYPMKHLINESDEYKSEVYFSDEEKVVKIVDCKPEITAEKYKKLCMEIDFHIT